MNHYSITYIRNHSRTTLDVIASSIGEAVRIALPCGECPRYLKVRAV